MYVGWGVSWMGSAHTSCSDAALPRWGRGVCGPSSMTVPALARVPPRLVCPCKCAPSLFWCCAAALDTHPSGAPCAASWCSWAAFAQCRTLLWTTRGDVVFPLSFAHVAFHWPCLDVMMVVHRSEQQQPEVRPAGGCRRAESRGSRVCVFACLTSSVCAPACLRFARCGRSV